MCVPTYINVLLWKYVSALKFVLRMLKTQRLHTKYICYWLRAGEQRVFACMVYVCVPKAMKIICSSLFLVKVSWNCIYFQVFLNECLRLYVHICCCFSNYLHFSQLFYASVFNCNFLIFCFYYFDDYSESMQASFQFDKQSAFDYFCCFSLQIRLHTLQHLQSFRFLFKFLQVLINIIRLGSPTHAPLKFAHFCWHI